MRCRRGGCWARRVGRSGLLNDDQKRNIGIIREASGWQGKLSWLEQQLGGAQRGIQDSELYVLAVTLLDCSLYEGIYVVMVECIELGAYFILHHVRHCVMQDGACRTFMDCQASGRQWEQPSNGPDLCCTLS